MKRKITKAVVPTEQAEGDEVGGTVNCSRHCGIWRQFDSTWESGHRPSTMGRPGMGEAATQLESAEAIIGSANKINQSGEPEV